MSELKDFVLDVETIVHGLRDVLSKYLSESTFIEEHDGNLAREYATYYNEIKYHIYQTKRTKEIVYFEIHAPESLLIDGTFSLASKEFLSDMYDSPLQSHLIQNNDSSTWEQIAKDLEFLFTKNIDKFQDDYSKIERLNLDITEDDVKQVLDQAFKDYSSFKEHESEDYFKDVCTTVGNFHTVIRYSDYPAFDFNLYYSVDKHKKEIYGGRYDFDLGGFEIDVGVKPPGFDQAFAPFKLLCSLMI